MDQVHVIRHKVLVEGLSQRQVAEQMGMSRNTVRKYLSRSEPIREKKRSWKRPVLEKIKPRLEELLEEWTERTNKKQRITSPRVHKQLISEGYKVGESTVRIYLREWRRQRKEVYVPLVHRAGDEAQVDFFEVTVELGGQRCKRWMFLMRLMYSGRDFTWLYEHCDQVSFLDGHVRAFLHFGGIPARCIYDNLKPAVRQVMFPARQLTQRFMALVSHYLFEPCFARIGMGHDKGGVEARGKGIRLQHLVPIPRGQSLEQIAGQLLESLDQQAHDRKDRQGHTVMEKYVEEQQKLRELPGRPFEPRLAIPLVVNRKALVTYQGSTYSLPAHWIELDIMAYVGPTDIRFIWRSEIVERKRVLKHEKNIHYSDYIKVLSKKPQAVRQVAPELMSELGQPFEQLWMLLKESYGGREAGRIIARVLRAIVDHGQETVSKALHQALEAGHRNLFGLSNLSYDPLPVEIKVPTPLRQYVVESAQATDFNYLLDEEVVP
jgi:transposase